MINIEIKFNKLPYEINYKCCYYSLGLLVIFSLININLSELNNINEINKIIETLHDTKIYWFIKRCLHSDINKRKLLLV